MTAGIDRRLTVGANDLNSYAGDTGPPIRLPPTTVRMTGLEASASNPEYKSSDMPSFFSFARTTTVELAAAADETKRSGGDRVRLVKDFGLKTSRNIYDQSHMPPRGKTRVHFRTRTKLPAERE